MATMLVLCVQGLFTLTVDGGPVRFGVPLPAKVVQQGLSLAGPGVLQWRRLPVGGDAADPVWVEVAIVGRGTVRLTTPGQPEAADGRGAAFVREETQRHLPHGRERRTRWLWCDGSVDERVRTEFTAPCQVEGELYTVGEARTVWSGAAAARARVACEVPRRFWEQSRLLPPVGRLGAVVRKQLASVLPRLVELPGARGAGDFLRSGGTVTNLEYDTALGLLRFSLAAGDAKALALAARCAQHLRDRDLDLRTGLPFPHGPDHRTGVPAPGHAWVQGLWSVGLVTADDDHLTAARNLARALAGSPPLGEGRQEVARDYAWPLLELEALLAFEADPSVARAADRLAVSIGRRFDPALRTFRFGEGELGDGLYLERGWVTGGLVIPALQRHLRRRPDAQLQELVRTVQQALVDQIGLSRGGLPTHWRCSGGRTFAEHREERLASALLLLDGLPPADLRRLLRREELRDTLAGLPHPDDPDLPTTFSMVARCDWVWR